VYKGKRSKGISVRRVTLLVVAVLLAVVPLFGGNA
jgi:hypothetical protein